MPNRCTHPLKLANGREMFIPWMCNDTMEAVNSFLFCDITRTQITTRSARIIAHYTRSDYLNDTFIVGSYDPAQVVNRVERLARNPYSGWKSEK